MSIADLTKYTRESSKSSSSIMAQVTSSGEEESLRKEDNSSKPPDGGWGWIIVLASFLCNLVVDGIIFSFGLLKQDITNTFNSNIGTVAWIGSLQAGCYLVIGPVVSGLSDKFGCRFVTIVGSLIATAGFIASYFANSVVYLMLTYGVIGGVGFGWIYLPAIVTVGYYFDKKRAFATGIAVCGSGIGTFVMPLFITKLLTIYHWNTCILILSTLIMTCILFGSFFKPIVSNDDTHDEASSFYTNSVNMWTVKDEINSQGETVKSDYNSSSPPSYSAVVSNEYFSSTLPEHGDRVTEPPQVRRESNERERCSLAGGAYSRQYSSLTDVTKKQSLTRAATTAEIFSRNLRLKSSESLTSFLKTPFQYNLLPGDMVDETPDATGMADSNENVTSKMFTNNIKNMTQSSSSSIIQSKQLNGNLINTQETFYTASKLQQLTEDTVESNDASSIGGKSSHSGSDSFVYLDPELCRSPSFLLMALSGFLTLAGFFVPFMFINDQAIALGVSPAKSGILLSIIGVTNTVGRVFSGWISDQPRVNALLVNNISLIIGGTATILSPILCCNFITLAIYGSIFGFCIACFAALRSVMVVDLFGREKLNAAFGLLLLPQGIATIIGTPLAGWLAEVTGSIAVSFYVAGSFILVSGLMCVPLKKMSTWDRKSSIMKP